MLYIYIIYVSFVLKYFVSIKISVQVVKAINKMASLLSTWNIALTYITDSIVCVYILSSFKYLGLLFPVAQVVNYPFIFRDAG